MVLPFNVDSDADVEDDSWLSAVSMVDVCLIAFEVSGSFFESVSELVVSLSVTTPAGTSPWDACSNSWIRPLSLYRSNCHTDWCLVSMSMNLSFIWSWSSSRRLMRWFREARSTSHGCSGSDVADRRSRACSRIAEVVLLAFALSLSRALDVSAIPHARDWKRSWKFSITDMSFSTSVLEVAMAAFWIWSLLASAAVRARRYSFSFRISTIWSAMALFF
mmetsp:Transcript_18620/g.52023  ORF Transcript_18620/g.52023 Transcript_18620/m.52023 type:complete len:219 (+) Transcript_18620:292-948(+)